MKIANTIERSLQIIALAVCLAVAALMLTGCAATRSTVTEYDSAGNILKKTESSESIIATVTKSTQGKTVVMWEDGWAGYISISSGTTEDPTPHGKIFAGKVNKGVISILPNQQNLPGIAKIIHATKSDVSLSLTDGVSATSSEIQSAGTGKKTDESAVAKNATVAPGEAKAE
nr:MAG TPA: protein of unknown function (DUF5052) [Caudoviricetes sp.]